MIKNLTISLVAICTLTGCEDWWEGLSSTGGGSEKPVPTQVVSLSTDTTSNITPDALTGSASDTSTPNTSNDTKDVAANAKPTDAPIEAASAESKDALDKCVIGRYAFITTRDNKTHFDAHFEAGGHIRYNLKDGPSGKWSLDGDNMDVYGPLKMPGKKYTTLHMVVSRRASDCKVLEFLGKSPGGQSLAGRRM